MIVYFDESYDHRHQWLLLGACFHSDPKSLYDGFLAIKDKHQFIHKDGYYKELKYHTCYDRKVAAVAQDTIDLFFSRELSRWRCIAIHQWAPRFQETLFGTTHLPAMRQAIIYKKFTELLFRHTSKGICDAALYTDRLYRYHDDRFLELIEQLDIFSSVTEVWSDDDEHQLLQITDLFLGCVLNHLAGSKNSRKKAISTYLAEKVGVQSFRPYIWACWTYAPMSTTRQWTMSQFQIRFRRPWRAQMA